jgi:uroporphyrinogen-III decarboxylase
VEKEYMKADEYDALILDPSDFWLRKYLPRIFGAFAPLGKISALTDIVEIPIRQFSELSSAELQDTLRKLLAAGEEMKKFVDATREFNDVAESHGFPSPELNLVRAPFDTIGDTLRGTAAIMKDIYRNPEKLLAALDVIANLTIKSLLESPRNVNNLIAQFPLHKGADGWMSQKHFETFYWPSLKKVMNALINEGMIVSLFAEGSFNTRLETVNEFPKGFVHWLFDKTDMAKAKKILGGKCSIGGNVSASTLLMGNPSEIKDYCRFLIETCAPGGGFILAPGAHVEFPKLENVKAMTAAVREYGVYPLKG